MPNKVQREISLAIVAKDIGPCLGLQSQAASCHALDYNVSLKDLINIQNISKKYPQNIDPCATECRHPTSAHVDWIVGIAKFRRRARILAIPTEEVSTPPGEEVLSPPPGEVHAQAPEEILTLAPEKVLTLSPGEVLTLHSEESSR